MRQLLKYELLKIMSRKSVFIMGLFIAVIYTAFVAYHAKYYQDGSQDYRPYAREITVEDFQRANEIFQNNDWQKLSIQERSILEDISGISNQMNKYEKQLLDIENRLMLSKPDSYEYKKSKLKEKLLLEQGPPAAQLYYNKPWAELLYMVDQFGVAFMGAMLLIGLSPIYSEEYTRRMDGLLLSSRHGRSKLIHAKCLAAILYTLLCVLLFQLINMGITALLFGNLDGAATPLDSMRRYGDTHPFAEQPYSFTVIEYYFIQLGVQTIGCIAFALAVTFISSLSRSSVVTMLLAGGVLGIPYLLLDVRNIRYPIIEWMVTFGYSQFIRVTHLFNSFRTVNFFGEPVLYPIAALAVLLTVSAVLVWVTTLLFRRRQAW
ncbi:ABC transporter permease subunit [Paenibacillus alvei]|uniref:ABC transporter permease subunit n=1 Tax=Paenibacillus alvei TaxID=44250 RepID=A0AAP6ZY45_PAEAL|nr:ABC transporter permease subunit [Paenibacillus alvei]NOJ71015.1 ABC transporter permease subunit [Paenibacillus alvei]